MYKKTLISCIAILTLISSHTFALEEDVEVFIIDASGSTRPDETDLSVTNSN